MPRRNDPCPCGSGKKYKHCCLLQEMQEQADRSQRMPSPDEPSETAPSIAPTAEPDPLTERMNEWWEAFKSAPYERKWDLVEDVLREEPELMDGEMVFEVGNTLFRKVVERDDVDRFNQLLESINEVAPEAYGEELAYILEWRFEGALVRQDWAVVEEVFLEFSDLIAEELDIYYRLIHALAYHGRLDILLLGMRLAFPSVEEATGLVAWAAGEFAELLGTYELLQRLEANPDVTADDPELQQRFAEYELTVVPEELDNIVDYRCGRVQAAWPAADFHLSPGDEFDEDPSKKNLYLLPLAWTHYAHTEEGVPLTRVEMVREPLYLYFVQRSEGELSDGAERGGRRKRRHKRRRVPEREELVLFPDRRTLDRFLGEMLGFLSFRYYEASALVELIPVWLRFLRQQGLADEAREEAVLRDLQALRQQMVQVVEGAVPDPQVAENLKAWPNVRESGDG